MERYLERIGMADEANMQGGDGGAMGRGWGRGGEVEGETKFATALGGRKEETSFRGISSL